MAKILLKEINNDTVEIPDMYAGAVFQGGRPFPKFTNISMTISIVGELNKDIVIPEYITEEVYDIVCSEETVTQRLSVSNSQTYNWTRQGALGESMRYLPGYDYDTDGNLIGISTSPRKFACGEACFHEEAYVDGDFTYDGMYSARVIYTKCCLRPYSGDESDFKMVSNAEGRFYDGNRVGVVGPLSALTYDCSPTYGDFTDEDYGIIYFNPSFAQFKDSLGNSKSMLRSHDNNFTTTYPELEWLEPLTPISFSRTGFATVFFPDISKNDMIQSSTFGSTDTFTGTLEGYLDEDDIADGWYFNTPFVINWEITIS